MPKGKAGRSVSYGQIGKKNNKLFVYEVTVENIPSPEVPTFHLLVAALDLESHRVDVVEEMGTANTGKAVVQKKLGELKDDFRLGSVNIQTL